MDRENLVYRTNEYTYSLRNFRTMNIFGTNIYNVKITLREADEDTTSLLVEIMNFKKKVKPQNPERQQKKKIFLKTYT